MKLFLWRLTRSHAVTTEALPAVVAQDMMERSSAAVVSHCVKHCGHWTDCLFHWLQKLLRKQCT